MYPQRVDITQKLKINPEFLINLRKINSKMTSHYRLQTTTIFSAKIWREMMRGLGEIGNAHFYISNEICVRFR